MPCLWFSTARASAAPRQAVISIATKIGCSANTLNDRVKNAEVDSGRRAGLPAEVSQDPASIADNVFDALQDSGYGQVDGSVRALAPALGPPGLYQLKAQAGFRTRADDLACLTISRV
ncbi:hypothetical protein DLJ49_20775 [Rhodovulum sp. 12E13]|uniref:DUF6880 family protein n=1 Tax=Rhodovulum sp. 12E13 TaxID=2203891 RepID=UPI000E11A932|nr:DUF6880 family protein [Rhodovulum sp. 12E13]RDC67738.1 hypothetical protein DLJ49_20775 [Rhodovulum sp. 12E13]